MTYNVFGGTLNLAQSNPIQLRCHFAFKPEVIGLCWRQLGGITVDPIYTKQTKCDCNTQPMDCDALRGREGLSVGNVRVTMRDP